MLKQIPLVDKPSLACSSNISFGISFLSKLNFLIKSFNDFLIGIFSLSIETLDIKGIKSEIMSSLLSFISSGLGSFKISLGSLYLCSEL